MAALTIHRCVDGICD